LIAGVALAGVVAGGDVEEELHDAAGDDGGEGGADQPAELVLGGEDYERSAEDEDHGNGEKRDGEEDGVEGEDADEEGGETGQGGHVLDLVAPKVERPSGNVASDGRRNLQEQCRIAEAREHRR